MLCFFDVLSFKYSFERLFMKKILFSFLVLSFLTPLSFADCSTCEKPQTTQCSQSPCDNSVNIDKTPCSKNTGGCSVDDDEYCTYNECYFDKRFIKMKKALCLSAKQETCINTLYKNFKNDMEVYHSRYRTQKNKLLEMIECDNECYKEQIDVLKEMRKDFKQRCKTFKDDVKELLCKEQYGEFRKFQRQEKRKMKKIIKYSAIHKLPCCDCCSK